MTTPTDASTARARARRAMPCLTGAALLLAACGCTTDPAPRVEATLATAHHAAQSSGLVLALAPIEVDESALQEQSATFEKGSDKTIPMFPIDPNTRALRDDYVMKALQASGTFRQVVYLPELETRTASPAAAGAGGPGGADASSTANVVRAPGTAKILDPHVALDAAFKRPEHPDLLLTLRVMRNAIAFEKLEDYVRVVDVLLGATLVWPSYLFQDEAFRVSIEMRAELTAVGSARPIWSAPVMLTGEVTQPLYAADRGYLTWGSVQFLTRDVKDVLDAQNLSAAAQVLLPYARDAVAKDLAERMAALPIPDVRRVMPHTLAVVVGDSVQASRNFRDKHEAFEDATAIADTLANSHGLAVPRRNIDLVVDRDSTRARILGSIAHQAARAGPQDTLVVYFSGYGFAAGDDGYLVTYDYDTERPVETAVSLSELAGALNGCAARQVIVLDTSFGGDVETERTLPRSNYSRAPKSSDGAAAALARLGTGRTILAAARPGKVAYWISPITAHKKSLFAEGLIETLARVETDGSITLASLFDGAQKFTTVASQRFAKEQIPAEFASGVNPATVILSRTPVR